MLKNILLPFLIKRGLFMTRFNFLNKIKKKSAENYPPYDTIESNSLINKELFYRVFENHPDIVFTLDINGDLLNYNHSVKRIFGYDDADLKGSFIKYFESSYKAKRNDYLKIALNGQSQNFLAVIFHKNGQALDIDVNYVPIFGKDKQVLGIYGIAKDVSDYIQTQTDLSKIKESLELAQQVAKIGSWDYSITKDEGYWSNQTYRLFDMEKRNHTVPTLQIAVQRIHPEDRAIFESVFRHSMKACKNFKSEFRIIHSDGTIILVYAEAEIILDKNKKPIRFIGTIQDITKRKEIEWKLIEAEQRYRNIHENLEVGIWSFDVVKNTNILTSSGVEFVTGYTKEEFLNKRWESIIHPEDLPIYKDFQLKLRSGETIHHTYRIISKYGEIRWVQDQTIPVLNSTGNLIRLDGIVTDITDLKKSKEKITHLAYHDYLTDLPNKRMFNEKMEDCIKNSKINKKPFVVMYLDLDRFKNINDTLGHSVGDKLLQKFADRVNKVFNKGTNLFARLSGDEFGIILWGYENSEYPLTLAKQTIDCLKKPFQVDEYELYITTSIGISMYPINGETKENLLRNADAALSRAKEMGKNNYQIYSTLLNISSYKKFELERDLRKAIDGKEFLLYFQPRVDAASGKIVNAEALIRWQHPEWGLISPNEFIPLAEENGLILEIGDWVFSEVCNYLASWKQKNLPIVPISINVSAQRFLKSDLTSYVLRILRDKKVDPAFIEFEITETTLIHHEEVVNAAVEQLKEIGIRIALDDFGTGYSSLTYLKQYPIDTIKIDKSFISNISVSIKDEMIVKSIIFLAKGLDMRVVAEGVETKEQLLFLRQLECDEIQGYLFSKPIPEKEFQEMMKKSLLKPQSISEQKEKIINRRKFYRIELINPLRAEMSLTSIKGKKVKLGKTEVLIEDISIGGIKFLTTIDMPVRPDIILQFETTILNERLTMSGHIVWKQEISDVYQYGIKFTINEKERDAIAKILNNFFIQYRNNPLVPNCSFINEEKINYLKKM